MSLRKDIVILLIIDILYLIIMEVLLRSIPAPYPVFVKIGDFFVALAISFVASFIFYFIQVHMPKVKAKEDLYPIIALLFKRIMDAEKELLMNYVNVKQYEDLSEDNIKEGVNSRVTTTQDAPLFFVRLNRYADWVEYGSHQLAYINKNWTMIMHFNSYLDSRCMSIMARIQNNTLLDFFRIAKSIHDSVRINNLSDMLGAFIRLWGLIKEQEVYYNAVFAKYRR